MGINTQILDEKRKQQRQALHDKLETIDFELIEFTNLNVYGSPRGSPAGSGRNSQTFETMSVISDCSHFDANEMKQTIHNLIQYLQDYLPLKMRKQIDNIKIKINDSLSNNSIDIEMDKMSKELRNGKQEYLNHSMDLFDEFDKINMQIPLTVADIPVSIKSLLQKIESAQHMNQFFALV